MKKLIAILAVTASLVTASYAGSQTPLQNDTNVLAIVTTNTYALPNDSLVNSNGVVVAGNLVDVTKSTILWLSAGGLFYNTTNAVQSVTVRLSGSVDGSSWTNNAAAVVIAVPALSSNYQYGFLSVSSPMPNYAVRTVENTNNFCVSTNAGGGVQLKAHTRTGI